MKEGRLGDWKSEPLWGVADGRVPRARRLSPRAIGPARGRTRSGHGSLVFVGGEAGVGKTTLAKKFCEIAGGTARTAWGVCESLSTPSALGPVVEIAEALDEAVARLFDDLGHRGFAFRSLLDLLRASKTASVLVAEDVHLADEATLDFLRFIGRRIGETAALLIATYRDDEVGPARPLRVLMGDLATSLALHRMTLPPLSEAAVRVMASGSGLDAELLHQRTGGNPFFVAEILTSGELGMPATVLDAVLARASRLSGPARATLEVCAVIGTRVEPWLLERVASPALGAIDECLSRGMLRAAGALLAFRHDLTREAILRSLSVPRMPRPRTRRASSRYAGRLWPTAIRPGWPTMPRRRATGGPCDGTRRRRPDVRRRSGPTAKPQPSTPGCCGSPMGCPSRRGPTSWSATLTSASSSLGSTTP